MLYLVIGRDSADSPRLRQQHLQAHLAWVLTVLDRIRVAGPVRSAPDGDTTMSVYILEAVDEADVRRFLAGDPYFQAGVWKEFEIRPFTAAAGTWVGGATWLKR